MDIRVRSTRRTITVAAVLAAALLLPLTAGGGANAGPLPPQPPGCTTAGSGMAQCSYVTGGGTLHVIVATNVSFSVHWGPPSNPFANTCGYGQGLGASGTFICRVAAGHKITATVWSGVITVRDRPLSL